MTEKGAKNEPLFHPLTLRRSPELHRRVYEGMTPLLCHPEGFSPKGLLLLGFFPFASLRVRMTERRGFFGC